MPGWLKPLLRSLPALIGLLLLFGALYVVQREFRHLHIADIGHALHAMPTATLLAAFGITIAAYCVLSLYDRLGTLFAGHPVSQRRALFASFCAYALAHNLGFSAVSGAAVRYRLYAHWGLTGLEIGKLVAFCSLSFSLGGITLGGLVLLFEAHAMPYFGQHFPLWLLHGVGLCMWAVVAGYLVASLRVPELRLFGHRLALPSWRMAIAQVVLACSDISITASIVYTLLPHAHGLTYPRLLAVYLASYCAGLIAALPGGLGVFDSVMLLGLAPYMPAASVVGAILVFRLYYYIIPLFLAGSLFAGNEILVRGRGLLHRPATVAPLPAPRWSEPDFAVAAGTAAVAVCGVLLLSLGLIEQRPETVWFDPDFAYVASQAGEYAPSLIGAALLVLAAALSRRVNLAWGTTILLLLAAAVFTWVQGEPRWIAGVLLLATLLIAPYRGAFYRHARVLTGVMRPSVAAPLLVLMACIAALALSAQHVRWLGDNSFWKVVLSSDVPNSVRLSIALAVAVGMTALWRLLKPGRVAWLVWDAGAAHAYAELGALPPSRAEGLLWGEAERAGIAFRRAGGVLLGIGDPVGGAGDRLSAIWRLRDLARQEGRGVAIWGAERALLPAYFDLGLTALPLDAEGRLAASDAAPAAERFLVCAAERDLSALLALLPELQSGQPHAAPALAPA